MHTIYKFIRQILNYNRSHFTFQLAFLPYFPNHFTIQLIFLPYFQMFSSYQKQALTVMISPLCTNCHDITVILLNVALNTINLTLYFIYKDIYLPTYLSTFLSELQILFNFCQLFSYLDEFQISTIKFILHNSLTQCSIFRTVRKLIS